MGRATVKTVHCCPIRIGRNGWNAIGLQLIAYTHDGFMMFFFVMLALHCLAGGTSLDYTALARGNPDYFPPGYRMEPDAPYNWTADPAQRHALAAAVRCGADMVDAISFSPPWWMTISKDTAGGHQGVPNLKVADYPAFADYLAEVVHKFATDWGIRFKTLAPFNEPLHRWWYQGNKQEGNEFWLNQILPFMRTMRKALDERGLSDVRLKVVEDWPDATLNFLRYLGNRSEEDRALVSSIGVHGYRQHTHVSTSNFSSTYYTHVKDVSEFGFTVLG